MSAQDTIKAPTPPTVTVTEADQGNDIEVPVGGMLVVRLGSNPSTGYGWHFVAAPGSLFRLVGHSYTPGVVEPGRVGGGGVEELHFVIAEGAPVDSERAEWLRMVSIRSFQRELEGATSWAVRLIVPAAWSPSGGEITVPGTSMLR